MSQILDKLKKLQGRGLDELRVRGGQWLAASAERRGWSAQSRLPDDRALFKLLDGTNSTARIVTPADLLAHFRVRRAPNFFAAFSDREGTVETLKRRWPEGVGALVEQAERVESGVFDLLGLRGLSFGSPIDWRLEPLSGKRSPLVHWSQIGELDAEETGDKKIVWELNRHQHFVTLGRAYWVTNDERYARTFVAHVASWMDQNPPKLGLNWLSSLEVAFRAISWLWALYFFKDSPHLTPEVFMRLLKYLYLHARHLETYLSTYSSPNTHLTGEALGLYYLGLLLPEFRAAERWRTAAEKILLGELPRHVRPDGVYFEQSSYYQRYTTDFYTHFYVLSETNGASFGREIADKLQLLLGHLMHLTRPDGTTPLYGDDDGGKLLKFEARRPNDFRAALATGAALFARADYKYVAAGGGDDGDGGAAEETLWLLGREGLEAFDRLDAREPSQASRAFPDGGYYVMRDGWGHDSNYLLLDCGPHGTLNCGHAHADALAFDLAARGRTLLVDPGTYAYTTSPELRDYFRGAAAHNTLTVDGESSSVPAGPFTWRHVAQAAAHDWISHARFDYFAGEHDGYLRLPAPARHVRSVLFLKGDYWIVRDRVETDGPHQYDLRFHFAPGASPVIEPEGDGAPAVRERSQDTPGLSLFTFGGGAWREEGGWVSSCYAGREAAPVLSFTGESHGPQEFITFLIPHRAHAGQELRVRELEAATGRAFEVYGDGDDDDDARDLLLLGGATVAAGVTIETDFDWAWLRRAPGEVELLEELVLVGGRRLSLGGHEIMNVGRRVEYAVVRRVAGAWRIETDVGEMMRVPLRGADERNSRSELESVK
ncbi:MAG: alginate lyase family protein [Pyrinomonadaceae bacterium]